MVAIAVSLVAHTGARTTQVSSPRATGWHGDSTVQTRKATTDVADRPWADARADGHGLPCQAGATTGDRHTARSK